MDRTLDFKAVIYDMDGILIDSEPLWRKAEIATFNELGFDFSEEMCRETMGMRTKEVIAYWHEKLQWHNASIEQVTDTLLQKISELIKTQGHPMKGVYESLEHFSKQQIPIALASSSPLFLIKQVLEKLKITHYFKVIESAEQLPYGKPHPQLFINTAQKLNIKPQHCLVIEDSFHGMIAAKAALMQVVVIPEKEKINENRWCVANKQLTSLLEICLNY